MAAASFYTLAYWTLFGAVCVYVMWRIHTVADERRERRTSRQAARRIRRYRA